MDPIQLSIVATEGDAARPSGYLLRDDAGTEYYVSLPSPTRATPPAPALQMGMPVEEMTPRQIQTAIRSGLTSQEIADRFGVDLARVMRFEGPVLLERAHIAQRARNTSLRRAEGLRPLVDVVIERLDLRGDDSASLEWDAWRRDDGRWLVQATWLTLGTDIGEDSMSSATWIFDNVGRTIVPNDAASRSLVENVPTEEPKHEVAKPAAGGDPYEGPVNATREIAGESDDISAIADVMASAPSNTPPSSITPSPNWRPVLVDGGLTEGAHNSAIDDELVDDELVADDSVQIEDDIDATPIDATPIDPTPIESGTNKKSSRRTSVPSWDEILFGSSPSTRQDD